MVKGRMRCAALILCMSSAVELVNSELEFASTLKEIIQLLSLIGELYDVHFLACLHLLCWEL